MRKGRLKVRELAINLALKRGNKTVLGAGVRCADRKELFEGNEGGVCLNIGRMDTFERIWLMIWERKMDNRMSDS